MGIEEVAPVESEHRLGLSAMTHITDPGADWAVRIIVLATAAVVLFVLIDLFRRGRARATSLALTRMLALLGPLLGLCGAAICVMGTSIRIARIGTYDPASGRPISR